MSRRLGLVFLAIVALTSLAFASAQRGFVSAPIRLDPSPPSSTCGANCCPSNRICICGGCYDPVGPIPSCAAPGPFIVYSCCDDLGTPCNRCNRQCCLGEDTCSCKGTCLAPGAPQPTCTPDDFGVFGEPVRNCCEMPETGERCSGPPLKATADW